MVSLNGQRVTMNARQVSYTMRPKFLFTVELVHMHCWRRIVSIIIVFVKSAHINEFYALLVTRAI